MRVVCRCAWVIKTKPVFGREIKHLGGRGKDKRQNIINKALNIINTKADEKRERNKEEKENGRKVKYHIQRSQQTRACYHLRNWIQPPRNNLEIKKKTPRPKRNFCLFFSFFTFLFFQSKKKKKRERAPSRNWLLYTYTRRRDDTFWCKSPF